MPGGGGGGRDGGWVGECGVSRTGREKEKPARRGWLGGNVATHPTISPPQSRAMLAAPLPPTSGLTPARTETRATSFPAARTGKCHEGSISGWGQEGVSARCLCALLASIRVGQPVIEKAGAAPALSTSSCLRPGTRHLPRASQKKTKGVDDLRFGWAGVGAGSRLGCENGSPTLAFSPGPPHYKPNAAALAWWAAAANINVGREPEKGFGRRRS